MLVNYKKGPQPLLTVTYHYYLHGRLNFFLWASLPWFDPLLAAPEIKLSATNSAKRKD